MLEFIGALIIVYLISSYLLLLYPQLIHPPKAKAMFSPRHISHRGGAGERIENTMEAFKNAVTLGSDMLELDCHLTKDGEVVILHDSNLERTTGVNVEVHELNYSQLPPYLPELEIEFHPGNRCKAAQEVDRRILRLEDLFRAFPTMPMNIDIKVDSDELIAKVANLVRQYKREKFTVWGSFNASVSDKCLKANPNIARFFPLAPVVRMLLLNVLGIVPFMPLAYDYLELPLVSAFNYPQFREKYQLQGIKSRVLMWLIDWFIMSPRLFKHLEARGIPVIFWVCNTEEAYRNAFEVGAHGVMTDYPRRLCKFLDQTTPCSIVQPAPKIKECPPMKSKHSSVVGEQAINAAVLTKFSKISSRRAVCRNAVTSTRSHTSAELRMIGD